MRSRIFRYVLLGIASICGACEMYEPDEEASNTTLRSAASLSPHYAEVIFENPQGKASPDDFLITKADGSSLKITAADLRDDPHHVLLTTATQLAVGYTLWLSGSEERVAFTGKSNDDGKYEPDLDSAISLSNTTVLLTFNEEMDPSTLARAEYYRIVAADDSTPRQDVGGLTIESAIPGPIEGSYPTTVMLVTSPQEAIEYEVKVTNVANKDGKLIHPAHSQAAFSALRHWMSFHRWSRVRGHPI